MNEAKFIRKNLQFILCE